MGKTYFGVPRYYCILKLIPHVFCFRDLAPFRPAGAAVLQPAAGAPALAPAVSRPMSADAASPLSVVRGLFVAHPPSSQAAGRPALEVLTSAALDDLWKQGFAVLDSALDPAMAHCAGAEALVKEQQASGGFEDAGLAGQDARVRDDRTVFLKPELGPVGSPLLVAAVALMAAVHRDVSKQAPCRCLCFSGSI